METHTGSEHGAEPREEPVTVVLVEDDVELRDTLGELLESAGYRVMSFGRADTALSRLDAGEHADLVLLDLAMPGMNGWQFRVEQRARSHLRDLPVIAMSADESSAAAAIDADAFLRKPLEMEALLATMERVLLARERKRLFRKTLEFERLRGLGLVVAQVTHEINNPLTYVLGHLELAADRLAARCADAAGSPDESLAEIRRDVSAAKDGAERTAAVVKLLSMFSRRMDEPPKAVDVVKALAAATRLAMHHIGERARLVSSLAPVQRVLGNDGQLAQVFLNLLVNAAQAIPHDSLDTQTIGVRTSMEGGDVVVEISDTGVGMEPEVARHVFDAFFTTKPAGEGTGLGLSISKGIVDNLGGRISVESAPGRGATFRVCLPGWAEAELPRPEPVTAKPLSVARKVLVIDDEPALGSLLRAVLCEDDVEAFSDPRSALRQLAAGEVVDVVLCDFQMPGMNGMEVYAKMRELRPDCAQRFVLMTGAVGNDQLDEFLRTHSIDLLAKPFRAAELTACLTRVGLRAEYSEH